MDRLALILALVVLLTPAASAGEGLAPADTRYPLRAQCALNLLDVGCGIQAFVLAHSGTFPSKLADAFRVDTASGNWRALICPATGPRFTDTGLIPSYAYLNLSPGRKDSDSAEDNTDILVFDREPVHEGGRNVLLADRRTVEYLTETEFQNRLAAQAAKWQKRSATQEVPSDDFIPLDRDQITGYQRAHVSFLHSMHFTIIAVLLAAIALVSALLIMHSRRKKAPAGGIRN